MIFTKIKQRNVKSVLAAIFMSGHEIQDEGVSLPQRGKLNFKGAGVSATDDAANDRTDVTISSGGGGTPGGSTTQIQFNNAGAFAGFGSWNGSTFGIGTLGYSDTNINAFFQSNVNSYNQMVLQNTNAGATASTNFNVSNNNATSSTNFGEFGINSSGFTGSPVFSQPGYVYLASASTDLVIGTYGNNAIHFVVNNRLTDAITIAGTGAVTFNSNTTSITTFNSSGARANNFSGSWTAAGNFDYQAQFGGSFTTTATASDELIGYLFNPTLIRNGANPATQKAVAVDINPTFTNSPTFPISFRVRNGASVFGSLGGNFITGDLLNLTGITNGSIIRALSSSGSTRFLFNEIGTSTQQSATGAGTVFITQIQGVGNSGTTNGISYTGGSHTSQTASELLDINYNLARTVQFTGSTGFATQRAFLIQAPTYAFVSATGTITNAATFAVSGAPVAGTNAAITNPYSIWVQSGTTRFDGNISIGAFNMVLDTTTGTKIGTATGQKIGLWNATPVIQQTNAIAAAAFVANTSGIVNDSATFGGYTMGQVVAVLKIIGALA